MTVTNTLSVSGALSGKRILITGVTGFLGKAVMEKLLRDVPDIASIKILIRGSKEVSATERFQNHVVSSSLFDSLRHIHESDFEQWLASKVEVIEGELTQPFFGMSHQEFAQLAQGLDIIINSAASVNFREPLDQALEINTLCLNNIVTLAKSGDAVTPVVQVSTCYVNGFNSGEVFEKVLSPASGKIPAIDDDTYQVFPLIRLLQEKIERITEKSSNLQDKEQKLIRLGIQQSQYYGWNDTYTFTKWLGEQLLIQELGKQNLTILRPSIIESTIESPVPGWVEGVKVADAMIYAYAKGRVSIFPGDDRGVLDVIPVDLVANSVILSAAEVLQEKGKYKIYQCCSGKLNPIRLSKFIDLLQEESKRSYKQFPKLFAGKPQDTFKTVTPKRFKTYMAALKAITWVKTAAGRTFGSSSASRLMQKVRTTTELAVIFGFYSAPRYQYDSSRLESLHRQFSAAEQKTFNVRADCFNWQTYLQDIHLPGLHKYALADKPIKQVVKAKNKKNSDLKKAA